MGPWAHGPMGPMGPWGHGSWGTWAHGPKVHEQERRDSAIVESRHSLARAHIAKQIVKSSKI